MHTRNTIESHHNTSCKPAAQLEKEASHRKTKNRVKEAEREKSLVKNWILFNFVTEKKRNKKSFKSDIHSPAPPFVMALEMMTNLLKGGRKITQVYVIVVEGGLRVFRVGEKVKRWRRYFKWTKFLLLIVFERNSNHIKLFNHFKILSPTLHRYSKRGPDQKKHFKFLSSSLHLTICRSRELWGIE